VIIYFLTVNKHQISVHLANLFLVLSLRFCILELSKRIIYTRLHYVSVVYVHPIT
jgi:hypothetical protein